MVELCEEKTYCGDNTHINKLVYFDMYTLLIVKLVCPKRYVFVRRLD